jgi:S-adenosylmethionine synthetase
MGTNTRNRNQQLTLLQAGLTTASVEVELFTWEKLDYIDKVKAAFGL